MADSANFSYELAFDRNIGWLTDWEQQALRHKCVAIAGMGGVGGAHLLTLARLGVGAFRIADLDRFELANFNRQAGATMESLGQPKVRVMAERARQINPELRIASFESGIDDGNLDDFLADADLYVDSLDFFVLGMRRRVSARCRELGIPIINAAPLGMGTAFLVFTPDGMSFEEWFQLDGLSEENQYVSYLLGMAPSGLHRGYLVDPTRVDLRGHRGPSTVAACELCAGVAAAEAVKLLLNRGRVKAAPYYHHFDAYRGRWVVKKLRGGNRHPTQRLKIAVMRRLAARWSQTAAAPNEVGQPQSTIEKILDLARWAPSGDNEQAWRFRLEEGDRLVVRVADRSGENVYEYRDGEPTIISTGMLLESMRIAATAHQRNLSWRYEGLSSGVHRIAVQFSPEDVAIDPLLSFVTLRSVDRRPYRMRGLTDPEIAALENALGSDLSIGWHREIGQRWALARLSAVATGIRLRIPETFPIHQKIIDWDHAYSTEGIPARAVGLDPVGLKIMRWAMRDWSRMNLANKLGGVLTAQLQMDYLPGLASSAFFTIGLAKDGVRAGSRIEALLRAGQGIQRFWLTATKLGLAVHPALAMLAFAHYGETAAIFSADAAAREKARALAKALRKVLGPAAADTIFVGRIGEPRPNRPFARSTRRPIEQLIERDTDGNR